MAESLHKSQAELGDLPESEIEEWRGYFQYKSECCGNCGNHPSHLMEIEVKEFNCGICGETTKKMAPYKTNKPD